MSLNPPKLANKLLEWFIKDELAEEVLGDLEEKFYHSIQDRSHFRAKLNYWYQVIHYLRPFALKNYRSNSNYYTMQQHNLKLTYRNFQKHKSSFLINLVGLTSGLCCSLLIFLWVIDELEINKFHVKDNQLYQIYLHHEESEGIRSGPAVPGILAEALTSEFPEVTMGVEDTKTEWFANNFTLSVGKEFIKAPGKFSGKGFFSLFSYPLKHGQPEQILQSKESIVISEELSVKMFGTTENVIGKAIKWNLLNASGDATITGVFETLPRSSTESFEFIIPYENFKDIIGDGIHWGNYTSFSYLEMANGTDVENFNEKIKDFIKEKRPGINVTPFIVKYSNLYLHGEFENGQQVGGRVTYVKLFSIISCFILVIACINFMNLTTARASRRMKEIGVKKSLGATRKSLIGQYLTESVVISILSLVLAVALAMALIPFFNNLTGKQLSIQFSADFVLAAMGTAIATGLMAGSYPAFYLSGFKPVEILKGKLKASFGELWTRKGLVVFQFMLSIILIIGVIVVYKQIEFIQTKNLGINRENILKIPVEGAAVKNMDTFMEQLKMIPNVVNASSSSHTFITNTNSTTGVQWEGKDPDIEVSFEQARTYYGMAETLGIEFVEGRDFSNQFVDEDNKIIFNETAITTMGLEDPIGKTVNMWGDDKVIIGVMKDFNYSSLHDKVSPMLFHYNTEFLPNAYIKIKGENIAATIKGLESFYSRFNPGFAFEYEFLNQNYQQLYLTEQRISVLAQIFAGVAIIISCLGLFGLAAFTAERKQKEIGIRKILGAADLNIITLLSSEFTKMVIVAMVIAVPLSYYAVVMWLEGFAYHIEAKWYYFAIGGFVSLLIAWFTVGIQTIKAAIMSPVNSLKSD